VAAYHPDRCNFCGSCVKRCHFNAFYHDETRIEVGKRWLKNVRFNPDLCWGCGLCANSCPAGAISMEPLSV
jgi:NAD-dependent dihydropyrimidine dehydrogenase PreA subunit